MIKDLLLNLCKVTLKSVLVPHNYLTSDEGIGDTLPYLTKAFQASFPLPLHPAAPRPIHSRIAPFVVTTTRKMRAKCYGREDAISYLSGLPDGHCVLMYCPLYCPYVLSLCSILMYLTLDKSKL